MKEHKKEYVTQEEVENMLNNITNIIGKDKLIVTYPALIDYTNKQLKNNLEDYITKEEVQELLKDIEFSDYIKIDIEALKQIREKWNISIDK